MRILIGQSPPKVALKQWICLLGFTGKLSWILPLSPWVVTLSPVSLYKGSQRVHLGGERNSSLQAVNPSGESKTPNSIGYERLRLEHPKLDILLVWDPKLIDCNLKHKTGGPGYYTFKHEGKVHISMLTNSSLQSKTCSWGAIFKNRVG
eukprot:Gb_34215 [translate_table: standard]